MAASSQWSASRTASATAPGCGAVGGRVGLLGRRCGGRCRWPSVPVHRAVVRRHHRLHLAHQRRRGRACRRLPPSPERRPTPSALKICSKGVPLKGLLSSDRPDDPGHRGRRSWRPKYPPRPAAGTAVDSRRVSRPPRPSVRLVDIRETPLDVAEVLAALGDDRLPAASTLFVGTVRDHDGGQGVTGLDYSAHPTALAAAARGRRARRRRARRPRASPPCTGSAARDRGRRRRGRHRRRPPGRGVRRLPRADRRAQGRRCRSGSTRSSPTAPTSGSARRRAWLTGTARVAAPSLPRGDPVWLVPVRRGGRRGDGVVCGLGGTVRGEERPLDAPYETFGRGHHQGARRRARVARPAGSATAAPASPSGPATGPAAGTAPPTRVLSDARCRGVAAG